MPLQYATDFYVSSQHSHVVSKTHLPLALLGIVIVSRGWADEDLSALVRIDVLCAFCVDSSAVNAR